MKRVVINKRDPRDRFFEKTKRESNGCLRWTGAITSHGYGSFSLDGKAKDAHRVAWFFHYGEWPKLCVCHKCDNRWCVEPTHFFEGTRYDNMQDAIAKGRADPGGRKKREAQNA